ncbi:MULTISPECIES: PhzF family phenazine biosynthesis protein [Delftia]|nr:MULTISPECIES: PhzF family phenazine biosynthesis protein [Delftia]MCP4019979.1 PhzF family phenazine biosynthesis protein [Delftia sp.]OLE92498.1 MAG: phenazine biosynthesis protein PhzF [Delftia sp. 13_1_40CM_3_66_6]MBN9320779.1 PhzF family phenazine biosynthesis protein [Delftia acidovorans]MCP4514352.1 PhzF family phenazine biosynthesis protein [Delftia sp.]MCP4531703.1 PhzF family phenazine biosynthesis protein [Delftia sp.]
MQLPIHVIDAFTSERFKGNQAAVIPLDAWLADSTLQAIAAENNLSETSFLVWSADRDAFEIRWFSPLTEIAFCGHATLASAFVLFEADPALRSITFWAAAVGKVTATQEDGGRIVMTFPRRDAKPLDEAPAALREGLTPAPTAYLVNQQAYVAVYAAEADVLAVKPDLERLKSLGPLDVVVTAPADAGASYDFVSRYFWPANGGEEDPVTGSIHAALAPYWAGRLGKNRLVGHQASRRTGTLFCEVTDASVEVAGHCARYLTGTITV